MFGEVLPMCRRNQLLAVAVAGFGLGLLLAGLFESGFFRGLVGLSLILTGILIAKKK